MKSFAIWAVAVVASFGALAGVTSATRDTEQVFVVVDTSFSMKDLLSRVPSKLERIDDQDHAEFALATVRGTESQSIHGYQDDFEWIGAEGFRPCSFEDINGFSDGSSADERIVITSAASVAECSTSELDGWTIIELDR